MATVFDRRRPDVTQGVFETLLVIDGRPVELEAHLARLEASLEELFPDRAAPECRGEVERCAADVALGSVRATVTPVEEMAFEVRVEPRELGGAQAPQPVAVHSLAIAGGLGPHKWADRSLLDEAQAQLPADALPLVVDGDAVLETSRANVFAVWRGNLFTPPLDGRILPGITRMRVIEIAGSTGLTTREIPLSRDDLLSAEEVFISGSLRGVERVRSIDGTPLAAGGESAAELAAELCRTWLGTPVG